MPNVVEQFEKDHIDELTKDKIIPDFKAGDTIRVSSKVIDGANHRLQSYEGVVIARENRGIASSCMVRKVNKAEGVERKFMIYSPLVAKIDVIKRGVVRRAKLFYLRGLSGKASRIKERRTYFSKQDLNKNSTSSATAKNSANNKN